MRAAAQGIFGSPSKDPVCGMFVDEDKTAAAGRTSKHQGKTYFFCSDPCKTDFENDPKRYAEHGAKEPDAKTKEAMMKELGMQERKAPGGAGSGQHDGHSAPPPAKRTDKKEDKTSRAKSRGADEHGMGKSMDTAQEKQRRQTATDKPESLLPPPPGLEMSEGREFTLPGEGK
jgi:YHS domain-containing protein